MPAFTLYGSRGSTNTDRVRLTLAEGGFTDYEYVLLNLQAGEQKVGDFCKTLELSFLFVGRHILHETLTLYFVSSNPGPLDNFVEIC